MRQAFRRVAVQPQARPPARPYTFVSPVSGWVTNMNLSAASKGAALVLDNWFPTQTGIRLRGGSSQVADIGSDPVESLFTYISGAIKKMFAADAGSIWDVSGTPSEEVTGQSAGQYSTQQFENAGGKWLYAVNGSDKAQLYNGSAWQQVTAVSTPIAVTGVSTDLFAATWVYRDRFYFIERNSLKVWYLAIDAIGGAAADMTLAGIFRKGGSLLFGTTWSTDSGDGADDKWVVVTTEGEVAVFEGADPEADDWSQIGRYDISQPLGMNATMRAGGDVVIATRDGLVPLSQAMVKDPSELTLAAVSRAIEPDWKVEVAARSSLPWWIVKWPDASMAIVGLPVLNSSTPPRCFVVNVETGAWCRYTGWDIRSLVVHNGRAYFGTSDGLIMKAEDGGSDNGANYVCAYAGHFDHLGARALTKVVALARATFRASKPFAPQLSASVNYAQMFPAPPNSASNSSDDVWDTGIWDTAIWDSAAAQTVLTKWEGLASVGFVFAPQIQVTCGVTQRPDAELMSIDVMSSMGGIVV